MRTTACKSLLGFCLFVWLALSSALVCQAGELDVKGSYLPINQRPGSLEWLTKCDSFPYQPQEWDLEFEHTRCVNRLINIIGLTPDVGLRLDEALAAQKAPNFWFGKTRNDLYDFFDAWLVFQPSPDDARVYMDRFYEFAGESPGLEVIAIPEFIHWLHDFMLARGSYQDSQESAAIVPQWMEDPNIDMDDFQVPAGGFQSFNEFFTRDLLPGRRPIAEQTDTTVLVSPADATVISIDRDLTAETRLEVKDESLHILDLLGGNPLYENFYGGQAVLCMLGTTDYHHFHAPVGGEIVASEQLAGLYYGMDSGWIESFFQHRRGYYIFATERFGYVGMVCVGMFTISSVQFNYSKGQEVEKGRDLGQFAYGGSAIILLFEPDRASITLPIEVRPVAVQMGRPLAVAN